jgi:hypothetical protein
MNFITTTTTTTTVFIFRRFFRGVKEAENSNTLLAHHDKKVGPSGINLESLESTPSVPATHTS